MRQIPGLRRNRRGERNWLAQRYLRFRPDRSAENYNSVIPDLTTPERLRAGRLDPESSFSPSGRFDFSLLFGQL